MISRPNRIIRPQLLQCAKKRFTKSGIMVTLLVTSLFAFCNRVNAQTLDGVYYASQFCSHPSVYDDSCLNNAIAQIPTNGSGTIVVSPNIYNLANPVSITNKCVLLKGAGINQTYLNNTSTTNNAVNISNVSSPCPLGQVGLRDMAIIAGPSSKTPYLSYASAASSGIGVSVLGPGGSFYADSIAIRNHAVGMQWWNVWQPWLSHFQIYYASTAGLLIDADAEGLGGDFYIESGVISNNSATGNVSSSKGIWWRSSGGLQLMDVEIVQFNQNFVAQPRIGNALAYGFMTHLIADSAIYQNILLDGSSGGVTSLYFTNSWASSSQRAHGVDIQGATGNVNDINFNGCRIRENSEIGINIASGANIAILNSEVSASSASSDNTWDNIVVGPGVSEFRIIDNRIGLFATAQTNRPRYGIIVNNGGSDNFQIIGNDLRGNGTAPLTIGGATGPNRRIVGNLPTSIVDQ